jgi:hypothetical protein
MAKELEFPKAESLEVTQSVETTGLNFKDFMEWKTSLATTPHPARVLSHKYIDGGNYKYLPIEEVRDQLDYFFAGTWYVEIIESKLVVNSYVTHLRLHYYHPFFSKWMFSDGIGASSLQVNKGANAMDTMAIKASAIEMSAPKSKTQALKNAAKELGAKFGANLNKGKVSNGFEVSPTYEKHFATENTNDEG